jgi:hypothetical protein
MADSGTQASPTSPEIAPGAAIPFRFEITWSSLTRSLKPALVDHSVRSESRSVDIAPTLGKTAAQPEVREWEMVLPKMKRQAALPSPQPEAPIAAPRFSMGDAESAFPRRLTAVAAIGLLALAGVAGYQWMRGGSGRLGFQPTLPGVEMGGAGWITEWASDAAGSARGRQLTLYRPSISMSDYNVEFFGRIERRSLGWVFRAADSSNYYAVKLETARPGTALLDLTRFAVINGVEGPHIQRRLPLNLSGGEMMRIRMVTRGSRFTISVQNQMVEEWEDDELKFGAVGFLNERGERGQVGSLQISFTKAHNNDE